jgi:hypothetical protein
MVFERACYNLKALNEAADKVKAITWSVNRKDQHFAKYMEIEKVFQFAADNVNSWLFDPDIELKQYRNMAYNYKGFKKSELDGELNRIKRYICNELNGILSMIRSGEVDYI